MLCGCCRRIGCGSVYTVWGLVRRLPLRDGGHECPSIFGLIPAQSADGGRYPMGFLGRVVVIYVATGCQTVCDGRNRGGAYRTRA